MDTNSLLQAEIPKSDRFPADWQTHTPSRIRVIDCHAHIFEAGLPVIASRRYTPNYNAYLTDYISLLNASGISHAVLVQPSFLGCDNQYMLDALQVFPSRLRGVVVVEPPVSSRTLQYMADRGVTAIRLNLIGREIPALKDSAWQRLLQEIRQLNWHVQLHVESRHLQAVMQPLLAAKIAIVIDHYGRPFYSSGIKDNNLNYLFTSADSGLVWVKLSATYRIADHRQQTAIIRPLAEKFLHYFGSERLVWGSDWPHTQYEHIIDFSQISGLAETIISNATDRHAILTSTPAKLYGWALEGTAQITNR